MTDTLRNKTEGFAVIGKGDFMYLTKLLKNFRRKKNKHSSIGTPTEVTEFENNDAMIRLHKKQTQMSELDKETKENM